MTATISPIAEQIINTLHARIDQLMEQNKECVRCLGEALQDTTNLAVERDALMSAGKLAFKALDSVLDFDPDSREAWSVSGGTFESHQCKEAMEALRQAGVQ